MMHCLYRWSLNQRQVLRGRVSTNYAASIGCLFETHAGRPFGTNTSSGLAWIDNFVNYETIGVPKNAGKDCEDGFSLVRHC